MELSTNGFTGGCMREFTHAGARISHPLPSLVSNAADSGSVGSAGHQVGYLLDLGRLQ